MKKILSIVALLFFVLGCQVSQFSITDNENYDTLSKKTNLKNEDSSFPNIYVGENTPEYVFDVYFKDIQITEAQYVFNKKSSYLCNLQFFIVKESNRNLLIDRLNQNKRFNYIDTGDTFKFTRRMQWTSKDINLILTSVVNSDKSTLIIEFNKKECDLY